MGAPQFSVCHLGERKQRKHSRHPDDASNASRGRTSDSFAPAKPVPVSNANFVFSPRFRHELFQPHAVGFSVLRIRYAAMPHTRRTRPKSAEARFWRKIFF